MYALKEIASWAVLVLFFALGFISSSEGQQSLDGCPQTAKSSEEVDCLNDRRARAAQEFLAGYGYYEGEIDGVLDSATMNALERFQGDVDLPATSELDPATCKRLFLSCRQMEQTGEGVCEQDRMTMILNTQNFEPFHYELPNVGVRGFVADAIKSICAEAGFNCIVKVYADWGEAQEEVRQGRAHGLFVIGWNDERKAYLYPSDPLLATEYGLFVKAKDGGSEEQPADLKRFVDYDRIIAYGPSNTSRELERLQKEWRKEYKRNANEIFRTKKVADSNEAFAELARVDDALVAVYSNKVVGERIVGRGFEGRIVYAGREKGLVYHVGFSKWLTTPDVVRDFNAAWSRLVKRGEIRKIFPPNVDVLHPHDEPQSTDGKGGSGTLERDDGTIYVADACEMWEEGGDGDVNWPDAQNHVHRLGAEEVGGFRDWRLPSIEELSRAWDRAKNAGNANEIFGSGQSEVWSRTEDTTKPLRGWYKLFDTIEGREVSRSAADFGFAKGVRLKEGPQCEVMARAENRIHCE